MGGVAMGSNRLHYTIYGLFVQCHEENVLVLYLTTIMTQVFLGFM